MGALGIDVGTGIRPSGRRAAAFADLGAALLGLYDAEKQVGFSGSAVTGWVDQISGIAPSQATASAQPAMATLNGRPGIAFDGTGDFLSVDAVPYPIGSAPCEIWLLASITPDAVIRRIFQYGGQPGASARAILRAATGEIAASAGDGSTATQAVQATSAGARIYRARFEANLLAIGQDGGALITQPTAQAMATGATRTRIGASTASGASNFFAGVIAAIVITAALSDGQATTMHSLLRARGNIS